MTAVQPIKPVRKELVVSAPQERAFRVFTDGIGGWWPRQHHIGASPMKNCFIEPRVNGRWYASCEDGTECDTGKVLAWDPPNRVVLAWQLTADWKYDPNFVTEVEVTFTPKGPNETIVVLEHRNLERYGAIAAQLRDSVDSPEGWGLILNSYFEALKAEG